MGVEPYRPDCQEKREREEACKLWMQTAISARAKKREALGETTSHAYQIILPLPLPSPSLLLNFLIMLLEQTCTHNLGCVSPVT